MACFCWFACFLLCSVLSCSVFLLFLVLVYLCALFNPGPEMSKATQLVALLEGQTESTFQFLLSLFIIISRSDRDPSMMQYLSLVASLVTLVKIQIERYLWMKDAKSLPVLDQLSKCAVLFPLFMTSAIFKLGSIALTSAMLRYYAIPVLFTAILLPWGMCLCAIKNHLIGPSTIYKYIKRTHPSTKNYLKPQETMENFLCNNVGYFIIHSLIITTLVIMVTIQSDRAETIWQGPDFSRNILVNNSLRLWAIWAAIMVSGIVSLVS